jgi:predicted Zn-dependent peptidase
MVVVVRIESATRPQEASSQTAIADELRKFSELLKDGIITKEEFDAQKQRLLHVGFAAGCRMG